MAVQISDFGLARLMDNDTTHVVGVFAGTVTHLAPEALQEGRQSLAADVYAFGILLFELLTAERAYNGKTAPWIADAVVNKRQRPVLGPLVPKDIVKLVSWCTEHEPADRPSIEQVKDALAELMIVHSDDALVRSQFVSPRVSCCRRVVAEPLPCDAVKRHPRLPAAAQAPRPGLPWAQSETCGWGAVQASRRTSLRGRLSSSTTMNLLSARRLSGQHALPHSASFRTAEALLGRRPPSSNGPPRAVSFRTGSSQAAPAGATRQVQTCCSPLPRVANALWCSTA